MNSEDNSLSENLVKAERAHCLPTVRAFNRIDGPGSSLDLVPLQECFWRIPTIRARDLTDPTMIWSKGLPRTIGITIDLGTEVVALPFARGQIAVESVDYEFETSAPIREVVPCRANWLLQIMDMFALNGVKFLIRNTRKGIRSAGMGGSATATTAVTILANVLAGHPFSLQQLVAIASRVEQGFGVSITGSQEQSNALFGKVTDYLWFPFGLPSNFEKKTQCGFGSSIRTELLRPNFYEKLRSRMALIHTGIEHSSTDVNAVWLRELSKPRGHSLHRQNLLLAYQYREALRLMDWNSVHDSFCKYREIRTELCGAYMDGTTNIKAVADKYSCACFPLGAGAGGVVLLFAADPRDVVAARRDLSRMQYSEIPFNIRQHGHELTNAGSLTEFRDFPPIEREKIAEKFEANIRECV